MRAGKSYVGCWLPEPVLTEGGALGPLDSAEMHPSSPTCGTGSYAGSSTAGPERSTSRSQASLPVIVMPSGVSFQPVDAGEVAARLAAPAGAPPAGRVPDMGGPQVRAAPALARAYARSRSSHRPVVSVAMPGAGIRGFREGGHLAPEHADGRITFDQFLAA